MEEFTTKHADSLLAKEWLVKVDPSTSTSYLIKFHVSEDESCCYILLTDTKSSWAEVITNKRLRRRWKQCNSNLVLLGTDALPHKILSSIHSIGGISDMSFDIVESVDADLSVEIEGDGVKWRWDAILLGQRTSANILSRHLILPLISVAHISFYSADPVSELAEEDLGKVVDKIGRTARRSLDTHIKHTFSKPRLASTVQRVSALLGLVSELPSIKSESEPSSLESHLAELRAQGASSETEFVAEGHTRIAHDDYPHERPSNRPSLQPLTSEPKASADATINVSADSVTESDDDDPVAGTSAAGVEGTTNPRTLTGTISDRHEYTSASPGPKLRSPRGAGQEMHENSLQTSSKNHEAAKPSRSTRSSESPPPMKKPRSRATARAAQDSDSDSDDGHPGKGSQSSQNTAGLGRGRGAARGVRQPLKRGMKRF